MANRSLGIGAICFTSNSRKLNRIFDERKMKKCTKKIKKIKSFDFNDFIDQMAKF